MAKTLMLKAIPSSFQEGEQVLAVCRLVAAGVGARGRAWESSFYGEVRPLTNVA